MGIVFKQSFYNTIILFLGFGLGAFNVLFLYTHFLNETYFGLIIFLFSTANLIMPLLVFGIQHTIIKFYSSYSREEQRDSFLTTAILLPLLIIIPVAIVGINAYDTISNWIAHKNIIIKSYVYLIFFIAIFMGYFEIFYSWSRVQLHSVFGHFIKEVFARFCIMLLLFAVHFNWLTSQEFIYAMVMVYFLRVLIMAFYALLLYKPKILLKLPKNIKEILTFSFYIILAGSAGNILLEIDKFMIPQIVDISQEAYYAVAIFIASTIAIPTRAMQQIINPITAYELNKNNMTKVGELYKKSSINLLIIGGLFFLLIILNLKDIYLIINNQDYANGIFVVVIISIAKLLELSLGINNAILTNSNYYKVYFYLSIGMAISVIILNKWLIQLLGINGAALSTLIVVAVFNTIKVWYVHLKMRIQPFSKKTLVLIFLGLATYSIVNLVKLNFHPIINITAKGILISLIYMILILKFHISAEVDNIVKKIKY